jgi:hypothetical protein
MYDSSLTVLSLLSYKAFSLIFISSSRLLLKQVDIQIQKLDVDENEIKRSRNKQNSEDRKENIQESFKFTIFRVSVLIVFSYSPFSNSRFL